MSEIASAILLPRSSPALPRLSTLSRSAGVMYAIVRVGVGVLGDGVQCRVDDYSKQPTGLV